MDNRIFQKELSLGAIALYCFFSSMPENFHPAVGYIAKTLGCSRPTVIKLIRELESRNIIKQYRRGGPGVIAQYAFTPPKEWQ